MIPLVVILSLWIACLQASSSALRVHQQHGQHTHANATQVHVNLTFYGNNANCDGNASSVPRPSYLLAMDLGTCYSIPDVMFSCSDAGQCFDYKFLKSATRTQALFSMLPSPSFHSAELSCRVFRFGVFPSR
jgi:hypothetical protein